MHSSSLLRSCAVRPAIFSADSVCLLCISISSSVFCITLCCRSSIFLFALVSWAPPPPPPPPLENHMGEKGEEGKQERKGDVKRKRREGIEKEWIIVSEPDPWKIKRRVWLGWNCTLCLVCKHTSGLALAHFWISILKDKCPNERHFHALLHFGSSKHQD